MRTLLILGFVLAACRASPDTASTPWRDTAVQGYAGPHAITSVSQSCTDAEPDEWRLHTETDGWAGGMELYVAHTGQTSGSALAGSVPVEAHPLLNTDYDPAGTWDTYALTLYAVSSAEAVSPGSATRWGCAQASSLAWMLVMLRPDGSRTAADCVIWGHQAAEFFPARGGGPACRCLHEEECDP